MTDVLLALILAVLILQNAPAWIGWARVNIRHWRKMRRLRGQR